MLVMYLNLQVYLVVFCLYRLCVYSLILCTSGFLQFSISGMFMSVLCSVMISFMYVVMFMSVLCSVMISFLYVVMFISVLCSVMISISYFSILLMFFKCILICKFTCLFFCLHQLCVHSLILCTSVFFVFFNFINVHWFSVKIKLSDWVERK